MIAADTSSLSAFFQGLQGKDTDRIAAAFLAGHLSLPPVVRLELLSDPSPTIRTDIEDVLSGLELLPITEGFWWRAGEARRKLRTHGLKAKVADAQIAQACIDNDVPLITRDTDFRHFAKHCGLKLA